MTGVLLCDVSMHCLNQVSSFSIIGRVLEEIQRDSGRDKKEANVSHNGTALQGLFQPPFQPHHLHHIS
jgi:hypothetical protein